MRKNERHAQKLSGKFVVPDILSTVFFRDTAIVLLHAVRIVFIPAFGATLIAAQMRRSVPRAVEIHNLAYLSPARVPSLFLVPPYCDRIRSLRSMGSRHGRIVIARLNV
jgi:hypothetical protein